MILQARMKPLVCVLQLLPYRYQSITDHQPDHAKAPRISGINKFVNLLVNDGHDAKGDRSKHILPFMVVKKMVMHPMVPMVQIQANMELIRASGEDELHTKHVTNISRLTPLKKFNASVPPNPSTPPPPPPRKKHYRNLIHQFDKGYLLKQTIKNKPFNV